MKRWYQEAIIYQIYPKTFKDANHDGIGDLRGIIEKIPYLKELGVNAIWLSPIYASPMMDNGYDISDYYSINPLFGTMDDFDELVFKLHQANIKLIMDLVINHTSTEHQWFKEVLKGNNKYHNYYFFRSKPNNWTSFFGGSAWEYVENLNEYYLHLFHQTQADLNLANPKVRKELKDILHFWLQKGVDGFRCDVINLISKKEGLPDGNPASWLIGIEHYANEKQLFTYLDEFYKDVFSKYDCFTIGECGIQPLDEILKLTHGRLDMIFNFEHFALDGASSKWDVKTFSFSEFKKALNKWQNYYNEIGLFNNLVLENHDQPRIATRYANSKYPYASLSMLATYVYLKQGVPFIYQGQELGMTNYEFKSAKDLQDVESINYYHEHIGSIKKSELLKSINYIARDHARTVMQWSDEKFAGFTDTKTSLLINPNYHSINVQKELEDDSSILKFYQKLLKLKQDKVFIYGKHLEDYLESDDFFIYKRAYQDKTYYVCGNNSEEKQKLPLPFTKGKLILNNLEVDELLFYPYQVKVYLVEEDGNDH